MRHAVRHSPPSAVRRQLMLSLALGAALTPLGRVQAQSGGLTLEFRGQSYLHRWSKANQHEFTPPADTDLSTWRDMLTINIHDRVSNGEDLAEVANRVVGNYQKNGKILQTRSVPRTAARAAEHLIVAVLGRPDFLEATFARCVLIEGTGLVAVCSHRVYGKAAGPAMSDWLSRQGGAVETAWMAWDRWPKLAVLKRLTNKA